MTDQELLQLSAKAAGYYYVWRPYGGSIESTSEGSKPWNPLTDDGDALRLAVKLSLMVEIGMGPHGDITWVRHDDIADGEGIVERHRDNALLATRRAIVRAAAEIGRSIA